MLARTNVYALSPTLASPTVTILLCTSQGARFLPEQLESIERQTHQNWRVEASDDDSSDNTFSILETFQTKLGADRVRLHAGPARGFVANFLSLASHPRIESDFYAFCDQDDIWEKDKLSVALNWLSGIPAEVPALYCTRTRLVDANGREIGLSPLFPREPSFANALVQSLGGANTMVFNDATRKLLIQAGGRVDVASHDWWLYLIVSACGGAIRYDPYPSVRYRQHGNNLVGMNVNLHARLRRANMLVNGVLKRWSDKHIAALVRIRHRMTNSNRHLFDQFRQARELGLPGRVIALHQIGIHRQGRLDNMGLTLASILKKI
jgi:glycosyltransferase involved in cell wall biosynthesis